MFRTPSHHTLPKSPAFLSLVIGAEKEEEQEEQEEFEEQEEQEEQEGTPHRTMDEESLVNARAPHTMGSMV
jgi:hypothetical protein